MAEQPSATEIVETVLSGQATVVDLIDKGVITSESNVHEIAWGLADNTFNEPSNSHKTESSDSE